MDLPTLNSLLRVNGLTQQSSPENITDVLIRSGYKHDEVAQAVAIIQGAPSITTKAVPAAYTESIIQHTQTVTHVEGEKSIFLGRIGILQFWLCSVIAFVLYAAIFILIEVTAIPAFSLLTGISLFAPHDFATVPIRTLFLFVTGIGMLVLPALYFLILFTGLQVRRCHDYGLSGAAWFMIVLALGVSGYLLDKLTPLAALAPVVCFVLWLALLSWPGSKADNFHGSQGSYPSIWGALRGTFDDLGNLLGFIKQYILPLAYFEVGALVICFCIYTLAPRVQVHLPQLNLPTVSTTTSF